MEEEGGGPMGRGLSREGSRKRCEVGAVGDCGERIYKNLLRDIE